MHPASPPVDTRAKPLNSPQMSSPPPINPPSLPLLPVFILFFVLFCFLSIFLFRDLINFLSASRSSGRAAPPMRRKAGIDPAIISSFPTIPYENAWRLTEGKCGAECPVCLSEFAAGDVVRMLTVCSHAFHPECIDSWLASHRTCPMCRSNLETPSFQAEAVAVQEADTSGNAGSYVVSIEDGERANPASELEREGERTR